MKKKVLILGANGFVGNILYRNFIGNFKVIPVIRRKKKNYVYLDFKNFDESFTKIIKKYLGPIDEFILEEIINILNS